MNQKQRMLATRMSLGVILLIALALRLHQIDKSLWIDEVLTYGRASETFWHALESTTHPLADILSHFALAIDETEAMLRLPSVVAGIVGVAAMFLVGSALRGAAAGLTAALLLALSRSHVFVSQEARYYAILTLVTLLTLYLLHRALTGGRWMTWLGLAVASYLGIMSQVAFVPFLGVFTLGALLAILVSPTIPTRRDKITQFLGIGVSVSLGVMLYAATFFTVTAVEERSTLVDVASVATSPTAANTAEATAQDTAPSRRYVLTPSQYFIEFYGKHYLDTKSLPFSFLLVALAAIGLVALWFSARHMAIILLMAVVVVPLPFFFVEVGHWYSMRYFMPQLPIAMLLVGTGLAAVGQGLSAFTFPRRPYAREIVALLLMAGFALPIVIQRGESLRDYYRGEPPADWRGLAEAIAPFVRGGDAVAYIWPTDRSPKGWYYVARPPLVFYLERTVPNGKALASTLPQAGFARPSQILPFLHENPLANVWIVDALHSKLPAKERKTLSNIAEYRGRFGKLDLYVCGRPTTNLVADGGFEGANASSVAIGGAQIVEPDRTGGGKACLLAETRDFGSPQASLPIMASSIHLRNGRFQAWEEHRPVGWLPISPSDALSKAEGAEEPGKPALALAGMGMPTGLYQALAPTPYPHSQITIAASARAAEGARLVLELRYRERDGKEKVLSAVHPGNDQWEELRIQERITDQAAPGSFAVIIKRDDDSTAKAIVKSVDATTTKGSSVLEAARTYTLSFRVKYEDIKPGIHPSRVGKVVITGKDAKGKGVWAQIAALRGTRGWHTLAFTLDANTLTTDIHDPGLRIGILRGTGKLWIDDVQFEEMPYATPFAPGFRPPHDELTYAASGP